MAKLTITYAHVCEYASISEGNKINILGVFDNISPTQVPYLHPQFFIVVNLSKSGEAKLKTATFIVENGDKEAIATAVIEQNGTSNGAESYGFVVKFSNVKFPSYGKYSIKMNALDKEYHLCNIQLKK